MASIELLGKILYVKSILVGVIPLRLPRSSWELLILCYCYTIAIAGPLLHFLLYLAWFVSVMVKFRVTFVVSICMHLGEVPFLIFPSCYLLSCRAKMKQLAELCTHVHSSSLLVGPFSLHAWYRKCCVFNLGYEAAHTVTLLANLALQCIFPEGMGKIYPQTLLWIALSNLTKSAVLLTMYGSVQYLMLCTVKLNELLPRLSSWTDPYRQETLRRLHFGRDGLMDFYGQLWQGAELANELFGPPLLAYLAIAFIHTTTIYYRVWSQLAGGLENQPLVITVHLIVQLVWVTMDLMFLMAVVGSCGQMRQESLKTQKLLLRLNLSPMDHKLKQSIEVFALQTLHQPIEFTACRMFTLDYTVLFSIAAAVTNYLIILIQFEMAIEQ
uniref:Gustatory receptor n=1 Tax=Anopheles coluzzii TaxID=1518534 RepID=A0A6E8VZD4_ANOCL